MVTPASALIENRRSRHLSLLCLYVCNLIRLYAYRRFRPMGEGCEIDRACGDLRLEDRRNWLWSLAHLVEGPIKLRGVDRRQIHHRQRDFQLVVNDLRPQ